MHRNLALTVTCLLTLTCTAAAQQWAFETDTGEIVAVLTMRGEAPYDHADITDLSLTAAGAAIFNLPEGSLQYPMAATRNGNIGVDSEGRLTNNPSNALVFLTQNGPANYIGGASPDSMSINFFISDDAESSLYLSVDYNGPGSVGQNGRWVPLVMCEGDADADGDVDLSDLALLLSEFGRSGSDLGGDVNGDGSVDLSDVAVVLARFGASC